MVGSFCIGLSDVSLSSKGSGEQTKVEISGYLAPSLQVKQFKEFSMKIWVDADACPVVIKEILFRAAELERLFDAVATTLDSLA